MPKLTPLRLRTVEDLTEAHEWLFNAQRQAEIDPKSADAMNTTLKGLTFLRVKLKLDFAKIILQSRIKKLELPEGLLPAGILEAARKE